MIIPIHKQSSIEVMHYEAKTLASTLSLISSDAIVTDDDSLVIQYNIKLLQSNKNILDIIFVKKYGTIIKTTATGWSVEDKLNEQYKKLEGATEKFQIFEKENKFHYVYPVLIAGVHWGWLHLDYSLDQYRASLWTIYKSIISLVVALLFATVLVSYYIAKYISKPILELRQKANLIASGDLTQRSMVNRDDEMGELARDFNTMVKQLQITHNQLQNSQKELEKKVVLRTKELQELNAKLDIKIQEAVAQNSQQEQMLIQQSRMAAMGEMIGNIAHQWRQPLNALSLIMQNIYYEYESNELTKEDLEHFIEKGQRLTDNMSKTIDDFRNFFRPNKMIKKFKISESIYSTQELISASYKNNNIELFITIDEDKEIEGYPNEFSQVLLNVLTNAKDALVEKKIYNAKVELASKVYSDTIVITITDNAGGIPQNILPNIFDPYFTTKDKNIGTGIGLYMSKMIIENNMHGKITAVNYNGGAKFIIEIPIRLQKND
ncbi:ATP-binding protein [Sulfurimonas sp.]